jgi:PleD family two-component response regulator
MVEKKQQQSGSLGSIGRGYTPPSPGSTNERDFTIGSFTAKTNSPSTATTSTHHLKTQSRFVTQEMHTGASSSSNHLTAQAQVGVPQSAEQNNAEGQQLRLEDDLTGAFKFEYLVHRLEYEVLRSRIVGGPLSVMVVSINRFSEIGITFGALALDSSMQELTKITNANLRALDLMGIYNEGKLIIVCPHTS